jgi:hypothetical protein
MFFRGNAERGYLLQNVNMLIVSSLTISNNDIFLYYLFWLIKFWRMERISQV